MNAIYKPVSYDCLPQPGFEEAGFALRAVQPADIEPIRQWRNAQMDVLRQAEPITPEAQIAYYDRVIWPTMADRCPPNILLSFFREDELIGYGGLVHIAWEHRRAEVSFLLRPELAANESLQCSHFASYLKLIKGVAFRGLGFNRLVTETYAFRVALIDELERGGFRLEGRMREHVSINGMPTDSLIHGCLRSD